MRRGLRQSIGRLAGPLTAAALLVSSPPPVAAQPVNPQPPAGRPPTTAAQTFELERAPNRVRRQLAQVDALEAEAAWDEAIELLQSLLAEPGAAVTVVEAAPGRFVSLASHCQLRLAALPPDALQRYRDTVDPGAQRRFEKAARDRDEAALWRIVDESFASRWGDDALAALAEIALERGDTLTARNCWRRISPLLSDPAGRSLGWALEGVDLDKHAKAVIERLRATPREGGWLVHPDTDLPIGDLLARMAITSIRERELARAQGELALLRAAAPDAEGRVAGRSAPLAEAVEALLATAEEKSGPKANPSDPAVGPLVGRLWPKPLPLQPPPPNRIAYDPFNRFAPLNENAAAPPVCRPVAWGQTVLLRDGATLRAVDLITGEPAINRSGVLHRGVGPLQLDAAAAARLNLRRFGRSPTVRPPIAPRFPEAPSLAGGILYARVGPEEGEPVANGQTGWRIIGRDLARENLTTLDIAPPEAPWSFGGPPVVAGGRLYVALSADDIRPRVAVACYSAATGRPLWQTTIASGQPIARFGAAIPSTYRLTLGGGAAFLNTNLGVVAAIERRDGRVRWMTRYERSDDAIDGAAATDSRSDAGCLLAGNQLIVAPHDAAEVLALDTMTGQPMWRRPRPTGDGRLLGVAGGVVVIGGREVAGLDRHDGALRYRWPDSPKAGLRGFGRGCVAGGEVFWPTRDRLLVLDAATGAPTRESLDIADLGGAGANLAPAAGCLIVAGAKAATVFGPINRKQKDNRPLFSQLSLERRRHTDEHRQN